MLLQRSYKSLDQDFYHSDHLGSASWITDGVGDAVQHLQYLPYGERYVDQRMSGYNERFTFTGKERDEETGYGYFGARYMDHELMTMWLSVDPLADKYPSISPYAYCAWNPVKLVDPDGNEAFDNDDCYINSKGEVKWFNSTTEKYTYEGEEYTRYGQTASMTNSDGEFIYGDQYGNTHSSKPLKEVSVTETLTDFERTMCNPLVQSIHQSAAVFWGHPVTEAVVDATLFVVTGGTEAIAKGIGKSMIKREAKRNFFKNANLTQKVESQIASGDMHSCPASVDGYAAKYGKFKYITGGDGKTYFELKLKGGFKGKDGSFEYIKDNKNNINHHFFKQK